MRRYSNQGTVLIVQIKRSVFKFTILPFLFAVMVIGAWVQHRGEGLVVQQSALIEESFLLSKRAELKNYVALALSSIDTLYHSGRNDESTKNQAKAILQAIHFGDDGYFFVYDLAGNNLVHPRQPQLIGKNLWNLTDSQGRYVIQALLKSARYGDGYERYSWEKPSTHKITEKLSYVVLLKDWGWMIGTGAYLDDVKQTAQAVQTQAATTLQKLVWIALSAVLVVFAGGLAFTVRTHRLAEDKLKSMAQRVVTLQEEERAHVSRELHDGIIQLLASIKFQFELAQHKLENGSDCAIADLTKGASRLSEAIDEVRGISHGLRPALLDILGLPAAITQLAAEFGERTRIVVCTEIVSKEFSLHEYEAVALFRTAQEALTNIERHALATTVTISLTQESNWVRLTIRDDGCGFSVDKIGRGDGIGLRNIRERIEHLKGKFDLISAPGRTQLIASVPLVVGEVF